MPRAPMVILCLLSACGDGARPAADAGPDATASAEGGVLPADAGVLDGPPAPGVDAGADRPAPDLGAGGPADTRGIEDVAVNIDVGGAADMAAPADVAAAVDLAPDTADALSPAQMCTGTHAALTRGQLGAATAPSGQCAMPGDLDLICTAGVATRAGICGQGCASMPSGMVQPCVSTCIRGGIPLGVACADCYGASVACTVQNCLAQCLVNPAAPVCVECQVTKGCTGAFFACTGLPGAPKLDAGTD